MPDRLTLPVVLLLSLLVFSMGLLSPLADDDTLSDSQEMIMHGRLTARAFQALETGQWPPRVDVWPGDHDGLGYPVFQFYAPLTHVASALTMKAFHIRAPYRALKLTVLGAMVLGGVFMFLACRRLTGEDGAALLGAFVFVTAPYLLINLLVRGAVAEAVGQCLIPPVLYATLCLRDRPDGAGFARAALAWLALLLGHTVTFLAALPLLALFVAIEAIAARRGLRAVALCLAPIPAALLAGAWFLWPVATYPVAIKDHLGPMGGGAYTTLWTLLAPAPVASFPLPDPRLGLEFLRPAVGVPALAALLLGTLALLSSESWRRRRTAAAAGIAALAVFALAFWIAWLPAGTVGPALGRLLGVLQFSYRALAQAAWAAPVLAAAAAALLFGRALDLRFALLGGLACLIAVGGYVRSPERGFSAVPGITDAFVNADYLPRPERIGVAAAEPRSFLRLACLYERGGWRCPVTAEAAGRPVLLPVLFYPGLMTIEAGDGSPLEGVGALYEGRMLTAATAPAAGGDIRVRFTGSVSANRMATAALALLGLAALADGLHAARTRERRRAAAAFATALVLALLAGGGVFPSVFARVLRGGGGDPDWREVPLRHWEFALDLAAAPAAGAAGAGARLPLLTVGRFEAAFVLFLEPAPGRAGAWRVGLESWGEAPRFGDAFPAGASPLPLAVRVRATGAPGRTMEVAVAAGGVPVLGQAVRELPAAAFRTPRIGLCDLPLSSAPAPGFDGVLEVRAQTWSERLPPLPVVEPVRRGN